VSRLRAHCIALAIGAVGACTRGDAPAAAAVTVSDSAGIRIVVSHAPAWNPEEAWRVAETPSVSIGTVDGAAEYQLANVRGVVELSDGRIVVANQGSMELRFYRPDGHFLQASGRRGQGPGDFSAFTSVSRYRGDSLLVHDWSPRRFSVIAPTGRFARSWSPDLPDDSTFSGSMGLAGTLDDGTVVIRIPEVRRGMSPPRVTRRPTRLFRYGPTGQVLGKVGAFPGTEYYEGERYAIKPLLFGRSLHFATGGGHVAVGSDDAWLIRELRPDGALAMLVRRDAPPRPVAATEMAAERKRARDARRVERDTFFRGMPAAVLAPIVAAEEKMFTEMPFPPTYPAYGDLLFDREGYLWVREFAPPSESDETGRGWSIFHPDGRWLGDVRLPPRFALHEATVDHVLGVQTDDSGVQFVRTFRIVGRSRAR
jgi:hypothetical protein